MTEKLCPSCQRPLPDDAPAGLCPVCALSAANAPESRRPLPPLEEVQAAFPQFEILECIGHGGMGVVYKVRQPHLDRILALKILLPGLHTDPGFTVRFEREARTLARLSHPGIVSIHDYGETSGFCWLTMEYVEGVNLRQAMQAARFTPEQALAIIPELCAALQYAHSQGVLHRDIKPENILLDAAGRVKIADFGIVRLVNENDGPTPHTVLTYTGSALGSPAYAAPEQIEQPHRVDHRADLYSLGVVLYEMLTGELPLGRFPAPSRKSDSPPSLDPVVFRTLEKEPDERYQSAEELRRVLESAAQKKKASDPHVRIPWAARGRFQPPPLPAFTGPRGPKESVWPKVVVSLVVLLCLVVLIIFAGYARIALQGVLGVASLLAVVLLVGGLLGGLATGLWRLWIIRQMSMRPNRLLEILVAYTPAFVLSVLAAIEVSRHPHLRFGGRGDVLLNVAIVAGISLAIGIPLMLLASPKKERKKPSNRILQAASLIVALLPIPLVVAAKRIDGHWPLANYYAELDLTGFSSLPPYFALERDKSTPKASVRDVARQLAPRVNLPGRLVYQLKDPANPSSYDSIGILAKNPEDWQLYAQALLRGIDRQMPTTYSLATRYPAGIDDDHSELELGSWIRHIRPPYERINQPLLISTSIMALAAAWFLVRWRWEPLAVWTIAMLIAAQQPVWVRMGDLEDQLMTGPVALPRKYHIEGRVDDARQCAQLFFDSAYSNYKELFVQILQPDVKQQLSEPEKLDAEMKRWSARALVIPGEPPVGDRFKALVALRNGKSVQLPMVHHDDAWYVEALPK